MNILDENIRKSTYLLLLASHISIHQIGRDIGRAGMQDEEIIPLLHKLRRPTFFTCDLDFYKRQLRHSRYCIVYLSVAPDDVAKYIRLVLRHTALNTQAKRLGKLVEVTTLQLRIWQLHVQESVDFRWSK